MILDIDPSLCTGCMACVLHCTLSHEKMILPSLARINIQSSHSRKVIVPTACVPCAENACLKACPEQSAIHLNASGAVVIEEALCTACGKCVRACGIGAIHLIRQTGRGKRGKAVALKCDQCGGDPWCVKVCPSGAITWSADPALAQSVFERIREAQERRREEDDR